MLIGINGTPGTSPLFGSRTDALTMRTALVGYGFKRENITLLLDEQATRAAIVGALDDLAARSTPSGITVVAIATHSAAARRGQSFSVWDGRISGHLLARRLSAVRGRLWTMLAMCYAGGYALPGVVGPGRVAIFSSSASEQSWQLGSLGSFAMMYIVKSAMIERRAPESVEAAFAYGRRRMEEDDRRVLPIMSDGVKGDLVLGPLPTPDAEAADTTSPSPSPAEVSERAASPPPTTPSPTPPPSAAPTPGVPDIGAILKTPIPALVR